MSRRYMMPCWFVTGADSGLGLSIALFAVSKGHNVVATARSGSKFPIVLKSQPNVECITLDIASPTDLDKVVNDYWWIEVFVHTEGFGLMGALEENTGPDMRDQLSVHLSGLQNVTSAVLTEMMRIDKAGCILLVSGIGAFAGFEGSPLCDASKKTMEWLSGLTLNEERRDIRLHLVEPGFLRTSIARRLAERKDIRKRAIRACKGFLTSIHGKQPGDSDKGAECIFPEESIERIYHLATNEDLTAETYGKLRYTRVKALATTATGSACV